MPCQESTGRRERSSWSRQEEARRVRKKLVIASELRQESLSQGPAAAWVDVRSSLPLQQELLVIAPRVSCHEHLIKAHRSSSCQEAAVNGAYSTSRQFVIVSSLLHLSCEQSRSSSHGLSPLESQCVLPLESRRRTRGLPVVVSSHQMVTGVCCSIEESSSPRSDSSLLLVRRCARLKRARRRVRRKLDIAPRSNVA